MSTSAGVRRQGNGAGRPPALTRPPAAERCVVCTIRNTVMDTQRTGKARERAPAWLFKKNAGRLAFLISTEKVGDRVLLRIDEVKPGG